MTRDPTFWILARASGLTAYVLVTLSVLAGLVLKSRPLGGRLRAAAVADTHRTLAFLGLGFVAVHGLTLVLDSTVRITPLALVVPGLTGYRPLATALGVLAAELMILIYASFSFRKRLGHEELAPAALGDLRHLRARHRPRPRGRHGLVARLGHSRSISVQWAPS